MKTLKIFKSILFALTLSTILGAGLCDGGSQNTPDSTGTPPADTEKPCPGPDYPEWFGYQECQGLKAQIGDSCSTYEPFVCGTYKCKLDAECLAQPVYRNNCSGICVENL